MLTEKLCYPCYKMFVVFEKRAVSKELFKQKIPVIQDLQARIASSKEFIDQNVQSVLCVKDMADVAHISLYHYTRVFKEIYNTSPYKYFINKKVQEATSLLVNTELPITTIAYNLGFKDLNSFSRSFRKMHKISPTDFRTKYLSKLRTKAIFDQ